MTIIPHPPYSPDLAPCDIFLFPKMKLKLKGRRFENIEYIQAELQDMMKMLMQNDFQRCFQSWKSRSDRCINTEGDYFRGHRGQKDFDRWLNLGRRISGSFE
jgi:hypothetical protein